MGNLNLNINNRMIIVFYHCKLFIINILEEINGLL